MALPEQLYLLPLPNEPEALTARQVNILRSPKRNGTAYDDSRPYLAELGVEIVESRQPIQFLQNSGELVHRWSPYVQGFSAQFVQRILDRYKHDYEAPIIFDPFAGSGTVLVQSKLNNFEGYGVELNPLLHFIAQTKLKTWDTNPDRIQQIANNLPRPQAFHSPAFLKSANQFNPAVLRNLEIVKGGIDSFAPATLPDKQIKDLMLTAFSAILIECSNLKRTPCLGYSRHKVVRDEAPFILFARKIKEISDDLRFLQSDYNQVQAEGEVFLANSKDFQHRTGYDLVITSPPYMNGLDYVINYKIEMGWLGFANNHRQLKQVKDAMVVCDNVSKGLIKNFASQNQRYTNGWLEEIKQNIEANIAKRGNYRRPDMPEIVHKYFDDMYSVMKGVTAAIRPDGRFILVVGDSLIADVYVPTDLLLAKMGTELGLVIERIEKARNRRSGQIRSYKLRETIITLRKISYGES
jgi:DNA modification methylase